MEEETITREEHEYTLDDARAVYAAFAGQCMEMNEARLATALGAALRGCNALEIALVGLSLRRSVADKTYCWCTAWDWTKHTAECIAARAALAEGASRVPATPRSDQDTVESSVPHLPK